MVLVPIGESAVTININGTQRVDELIKDDTTYNLTESLGSTIKVNGTTEDSFSQTSNSTYDVSVSGSRSNSQTKTIGYSGNDESFTYDDHIGRNNTVTFTVGSSDLTSTGNGYGKLKINGTKVMYSESSETKTFNLSDGDNVYHETDHDYGGTVKADWTYYYSVNTNVGGVNKS
jgi:hypothetical protein